MTPTGKPVDVAAEVERKHDQGRTEQLTRAVADAAARGKELLS